MDRRRFLKWLGIGAVAVPVAVAAAKEEAPKSLDFSEAAFRGQHKPEGPWGDCCTQAITVTPKVEVTDTWARLEDGHQYHVAYLSKSGKILSIDREEVWPRPVRISYNQRFVAHLKVPRVPFPG